MDKKIIAAIFMLSCFVSYLVLPATAGNLRTPFSAKAEIPENQLDKKLTYFDLRVSPGQEQDIFVTVSNDSQNEVSCEIGLHPAYTGKNGVILYSGDEGHGESPTMSIDEVAFLEQERVTIPPLGKRKVKIQIKMPEDPFDGVVLGGISVREDKSSAWNDEGGIMIANEYVYVIGLKLTETDNPVYPSFEFYDFEVGIDNYKPAFFAGIRNPNPMIIKDASIKAYIYKDSQEQASFEYEFPVVEMAPQSSFQLVMDASGKPLQIGSYKLDLQLLHGGEVYGWESIVEVGNQEIVTIKENAVPGEGWNSFPPKSLAIACLVALLLIFVGYISYRFGKKDSGS